jgi:hypothetical protein
MILNTAAMKSLNSNSSMRPQRPGQSASEPHLAVAGAQLFRQDRERWT